MEPEDNLRDRPEPDDPDLDDDDAEDAESDADESGGSINIDPPSVGGDSYTDP